MNNDKCELIIRNTQIYIPNILPSNIYKFNLTLNKHIYWHLRYLFISFYYNFLFVIFVVKN